MAEPAYRRSIGRYEVVRKLDAPDHDIYVTRRVESGKPRDYLVALFEVSASDVRELEREVERCRALDHPAIARVVELVDHEGKKALVFEHVAGASLMRVMHHLEEQGERLADGAILYIAKMLFEALSAAHTATDDSGKIVPIVHGELGPHQVFVSWAGEVKILGFGLSTIFRAAQREAIPDWARPFVAPEVRAGGTLTPRANAYSGAALVWSLLAHRLPPPDVDALPPLDQLRPELAGSVASALDRALDPSIRKRVTCQAVARAVTRAVRPDDQQELRWSMEVLRALSTIDDDVIPLESFPPTAVSSAPVSSLPPVPAQRPVTSEPPDSEEQATSPYFRVPDHLRHIKLPESVIPPEDAPARDPATAAERSVHRRGTLTGVGKRNKRAEPSASRHRIPPARAKAKTLLGTGDPGGEEVSPHKSQVTALRASRVERKERSGRRPRSEDAQASKPQTTQAFAGERQAKPAKKEAARRPPTLVPPAPSEDEAPQPAEVPPHEKNGRASAEELRGSARLERIAAPAERAPLESAEIEHETVDAHAEPRRPSVEIPPPPMLAAEQQAEAQDAPPPSSPAPVSYSPHASVPPHSAPGVPIGPYSIAPSMAPGVSMAPGAIVLPVRWLMGVSIVVAVTALASFALGLFLGGGILPGLRGPDLAGGEAAPAPPPSPATAVPTSDPAPAPPPAPPAPSAPVPASAAPPAEPPPAAVEDDDDGSELGASRGYLLVTTPAPEAGVYISGRYAGAAGKKLEVECGVRFVRIGSVPLRNWFTPGRSVGVACQGFTRVHMAPGPSEEGGGRRGKDGRWMPEGL